MGQPKSFNIPVKIAVAAVVILLVDALMLIISGEREWKGLTTLLTAADLTPLSALFWPLVETGGYTMLFGIDYARQAIWRKRRQEIDKARSEGLKEGREEGYKLGYQARMAEENGHDAAQDQPAERSR